MSIPNTPSVATLQRALEVAEHIEALQTQLANLLGGKAPAAPVAEAAASLPARPGKRTLSPHARARIAAAQKARWAKVKEGNGLAASAPARSAAKSAPRPKRRNLTPEGRARLAALMKARWAARKKGAPAPNARWR